MCVPTPTLQIKKNNHQRKSISVDFRLWGYVRLAGQHSNFIHEHQINIEDKHGITPPLKKSKRNSWAFFSTVHCLVLFKLQTQFLCEKDLTSPTTIIIIITIIIIYSLRHKLILQLLNK